MKLKDLADVLYDGTAIFTIEGLCHEYSYGIEQLKQEPWYVRNCEQTVTRVVVIGIGTERYKTVLCIDLEQYIP